MSGHPMSSESEFLQIGPARHVTVEGRVTPLTQVSERSCPDCHMPKRAEVHSKCPNGEPNGRYAEPDDSTRRSAQFREERQSNPDFGQPNSKLKRRARLMLDDFTDAECRAVVDQMINVYPNQACDIICRHWERSIEEARKASRKAMDGS